MTAREQGWGRQVQQRRQAGVFDALVSTGARLEDSCWLEPGLGVASWRNRYDQTRYHKPGHHTISVYLQGGEQTERLDGPGGHGGTGKVCIMPDHHRSECCEIPVGAGVPAKGPNLPFASQNLPANSGSNPHLPM